MSRRSDAPSLVTWALRARMKAVPTKSWNLETLSPACFGLVMATGIVSLAAHKLSLGIVPWLLFGFNLVFFLVLWALTIWRAVRHTKQLFGDMANHSRAPGFFTMVAGSNILGSQFVVLLHDYRWGGLLWVFGTGLWLVLTYAIFAALTISAKKPQLARVLSGGWLLAIVATQSVAVLAGLLAHHEGWLGASLMNFLALSMWLWGGLLYIWIMGLIFFRYLFLRFKPADLSPSYWINMGAMAISTLAGTQLIFNAPQSPLLAGILPFLKGVTLLYWAAGTWWIPLLLVLGFWRHIYMRYPIQYEPLHWGVVFPFGMYAASTYGLLNVFGLQFLHWLPPLFLYAAMAAWILAFSGLAHDIWLRFKRGRRLA